VTGIIQVEPTIILVFIREDDWCMWISKLSKPIGDNFFMATDFIMKFLPKVC